MNAINPHPDLDPQTLHDEEGQNRCRESLKLGSCLLGVALFLATLAGIVMFQEQLLNWAAENVMLRGPFLLGAVIADVILIVTLIVKGGCPRDPNCPHAYRGRWHQRNKSQYS